MQNIFDIHDYDEHFTEQFISQTLPFYDKWNIRPMQNEVKILADGSCDDADKFMEFMNEHSAKDYPVPIVIVVGNTEKTNNSKMLPSTMKYFKLKFDKFSGNDLGTPLMMGFPHKYPTGHEQMMPLSFNGYGPKQQMNAMGGISYSEIQGIVDRNVADASRSIRAEYVEVNARREAESIKRLAELETKMELYKLDIRAREVEEKERRLQAELDAFEQQKAEGLGNVKDYTKTIASGLLEVGKSAFGIEDKYDKKEKTENKKEDLKGSPKQSTSFDDNGFTPKEEKETNENTAFEELISVISNLNEEQKFALLEVLMPEEAEEINENKAESAEEIIIDNQNPEKDENIQTDDNN